MNELEKTLIFFIDALAKPYITKESSPFLYKLKKEETYLDMIPLLGYSSGLHPSLWKGTYQETHGKFLVYTYTKNGSPFKWIKALSWVPNKIRQYILGTLKAPYYLLNFKHLFPRWYKKSILPIPASIDPSMAVYFKKEPVMFKNDGFKIIKKHKKLHSESERYDPSYGKGVPIRDWKMTNVDVDHFFTGCLDEVGHYPGPKSDAVRVRTKEVDENIERLYNEAKSKHKKVNLFVFSDHGMVPITKNVNVKEHVDKLDIKPIKDYVVFYDSTMARFWVKNKKAKDILIKELSKVKHITYLDERLKKKYKINFKTRKWGDLMFLADPGYRVFPDYFAPVRFNTKGMHGYWPEHKYSKGVFLTNTFKTSKKSINIIDIMPTILKVLKIKPPKGIDGKSIINKGGIK